MLTSAPIKGPSQGRLPAPAAAILGLGEDTIFSLCFSVSALFYFSPLSPFSLCIISRVFSLSMHVFLSLGVSVSISPCLCDCISFSIFLIDQFDQHTLPLGQAQAVLWERSDVQAPVPRSPGCGLPFAGSPHLSLHLDQPCSPCPATLGLASASEREDSHTPATLHTHTPGSMCSFYVLRFPGLPLEVREFHPLPPGSQCQQ